MTSPPPLPPCSRTPNCVSTQAADPKKRMEPISYTGSLEETRERLLRVLRAYPRTTIVQEGPVSLKAECRSRLFHYVDDVDFAFDDQRKTIHFRSASREGTWDLGVNRRRMNVIRRRFLKAGSA
jgi:uncharacterized protein (DUF1499 family)